MATSRFSILSITGPSASAEEKAAIHAALTAHLASEPAGSDFSRRQQGDPWARAGRLDALGLEPAEDPMDRGWSA